MTRQIAIPHDRLIDRFAEALSECGSIRESARLACCSTDSGRTMFKRIRKRLGPQAR